MIVELALALAATYTVRPGQTLAEIGQETGYNWHEIYQYNTYRITDPNHIEPGWVLQLPWDRDASSGFSDSLDELVVSPGQTLSELAAMFGVEGGWRGLWEANRDRVPDPDVLHPGQVLRLPQ